MHGCTQKDGQESTVQLKKWIRGYIRAILKESDKPAAQQGTAALQVRTQLTLTGGSTHAHSRAEGPICHRIRAEAYCGSLDMHHCNC